MECECGRENIRRNKVNSTEWTSVIMSIIGGGGLDEKRRETNTISRQETAEGERNDEAMTGDDRAGKEKQVD